jgi:hypothetical protein
MRLNKQNEIHVRTFVLQPEFEPLCQVPTV